MLWITEGGGIVSRVDPATGAKTIVYTAPDFFAGSPLEQLQLCFMPMIGSGTLGLDLHPNFLNPATAYIYFLYSYNSGTEEQPATKFKLARLKWNWNSQSVTEKTDLVTGFSSGYDHLGGRVMVIMRNDGNPYIFVTIGDHGISEKNSPDCYPDQSQNPNNFAQDPTRDNGKVHRFNIDGSIPADNPIPGNSFYTRGHRNPQGLMYNPDQDLLYDAEHGDRTDDEVNLLEAGMNYGWKWVRGYHGDNNYPGEAQFIASYVPHPMIPGDRLVEAFYSFCAVPQPVTDEYLEWCTPAPSDGIYYNSDGIPEWKNSLLVVNLKNGTVTDQQVNVLKLSADGRGLLPSTVDNPNPQGFFGEDQELNGRLRDIAISPDGKKIFLINNGGETLEDRITVYTYQSSTSTHDDLNTDTALQFYPNPATDIITVESKEGISKIDIYNLGGELVSTVRDQVTQINVANLAEGIYIARVITTDGQVMAKKFIRQ
ncbi:MAG TPA: PQQ-dependent sugar dehydrogenase, partial [Saprospiraceae bacterium]|nr:PQQ-dependent sugar dehydrogenase [Saprospiraceae bacterium]